MKIRMLMQISTAASMLVLTSGTVLAADAVTIDGTGQDSDAIVQVENTTKVETSTTNHIQILNVNDQIATTGDVTESSNTNAGTAGSGNAANNNATTTTVAINNAGGGSGGGGSGGDGSGGGGSGGGGSGGTGGGSGGGSVEGAATTGGLGGGSGSTVATLPEVGASQFVDVSALRALYHPAVMQSPLTNQAQRPEGLSLTFLLAVGLISVIGAYGSAAFADWRSHRRLV